MTNSLAEKRIAYAGYAPKVTNVVKLAIENAVQMRRMVTARRRIARALSALNDHTLSDIGVSRSMIYAAACDIAAAKDNDRQA